MNIVIDTSILRKDRGFHKSDILLLKKLSKLELVNIHIPWIVYSESKSQNYIDLNLGIDKALKELSTLKRIGIIDDKIIKISKELSKIKSDSENISNKHWETFIKDAKITIHQIQERHGKRVMDSYFSGTDPFSNKKNRKDIPDAFIYESITSLVEKYVSIYFICDDKNLRDSVSRIKNCKVFESYELFFDSKEYKIIEKQYKKVEHFANELIKLRENVNEIEKYAKNELYRDLFAGHEQIIKHENIPSDGNEGALQDIENEIIQKINVDNIQFVNGIFYIPISLNADFRIEYFLFKSDYYLYEGYRNISIIDNDWNKHYYLVDELFHVEITFKCTIEQKKIKQGIFDFEYEPAIIDNLLIIEK